MLTTEGSNKGFGVRLFTMKPAILRLCLSSNAFCLNCGLGTVNLHSSRV